MCNPCNGEETLKDEKMSIHKVQLLYLFKQFPLGIEYDHFELPNLRNMIHSTVAGGNVMSPVARDNLSAKTIHNSIEDEVAKMEVQYLYGGGFYQIKRVRDEVNKM